MMKKTFFGLIILSFCLLSGCWDYKDIDDLSIPSIGGYDLSNSTDEETRLTITGVFPVVYPDAEQKVRVETIIGQTVGETRDKRGHRSPDQLILGMLQTALFGEDLAKQGLDNIIDVLFRTPQIKNTLSMAMVEGRAEDIVLIDTPDYPGIDVLLINLLGGARDRSFIPTTTLHMYGVDRYTPGKNPILPIIKQVNDTEIEIVGSGVFKDGKMIGKLDTIETRSLVLLRGLRSRGYIPFTIKEGGEIVDEGTVRVQNRRKVRVERKEDDFYFDITIELKGSLIEHHPPRQLEEDEEGLEAIRKAIEEKVANECAMLVRRIQEEFRVDAINISRYALARWRKELEEDIDQGFIERAMITVNVDVQIDDYGEMR